SARSLTPIGPSSMPLRNPAPDWIGCANSTLADRFGTSRVGCLRSRRLGTWSKALRARLDLLDYERPPSGPRGNREPTGRIVAMARARSVYGNERQRVILLQCMSLFMALSGHIEGG